ncbi:TDT family transporter [Streptomyces sp. NBC_00582]|uniref:TDT family transporter n=1 Tax=Streptomyces sp. NBC_00582 TaxID=2975783 RepID=UPI002E817E5C|nr:TDT family transporter [Streptomyces sp. NBC_00582]WUB65883.1 TDT family transporter [Streptomyces sp. NBC_00582]
MVTVAPPPPVTPRSARPSVRHLGPNWYATVMGTAIVGTAGAALPVRPPGLRPACTALWALSLALLLALLAARALHWRHHRDRARADLLDPATAPFHGCLAMALLAVDGGALAVGRDWIGTGPAVALDAVLFGAGTVVALAAAVAVPYVMAVHPHGARPTPVWLLPLVAPMVAAASGPALVPFLPPGQARKTLLLACLALFGLSLLATLALLPVVFGRLLTGGPLPLALTPTLFLVLGPLGQSTTAVGRFAEAAPGVVPGPEARAYAVFAVLYGVPVMGFALLWLGLAGAQVARARREGMGFTMTWWAFTFPVGTCVTGAAVLARHTGLLVYDVLAVALYVVLVGAWGVVAVRTGRGLLSGALLAGPRPGPAEPSRARGRTRSDGVR